MRCPASNPIRRIGATARGRDLPKKTPAKPLAGVFQSGSLTYEEADFNPPILPELRTKNLGQRYPPSGGRTGKASPVGRALPVEQHHAESRDREGERQDQGHDQKLAFRMHHARILRATNPVETRLAGDCLPVEWLPYGTRLRPALQCGAAGAASLPPSKYAARTSGRSKSSRPVPVSVMTPLTMT
jgi:hypothetical protein